MPKTKTGSGVRAQFLVKVEAAKPELIALVDKYGFGTIAYLITKLRERDKLKRQADEIRRQLEAIEQKVVELEGKNGKSV